MKEFLTSLVPGQVYRNLRASGWLTAAFAELLLTGMPLCYGIQYGYEKQSVVGGLLYGTFLYVFPRACVRVSDYGRSAQGADRTHDV